MSYLHMRLPLRCHLSSVPHILCLRMLCDHVFWPLNNTSESWPSSYFPLLLQRDNSGTEALNLNRKFILSFCIFLTLTQHFIQCFPLQKLSQQEIWIMHNLVTWKWKEGKDISLTCYPLLPWNKLYVGTMQNLLCPFSFPSLNEGWMGVLLEDWGKEVSEATEVRTSVAFQLS